MARRGRRTERDRRCRSAARWCLRKRRALEAAHVAPPAQEIVKTLAKLVVELRRAFPPLSDRHLTHAIHGGRLAWIAVELRCLPWWWRDRVVAWRTLRTGVRAFAFDGRAVGCVHAWSGAPSKPGAMTSGCPVYKTTISQAPNSRAPSNVDMRNVPAARALMFPPEAIAGFDGATEARAPDMKKPRNGGEAGLVRFLWGNNDGGESIVTVRW